MRLTPRQFEELAKLSTSHQAALVGLRHVPFACGTHDAVGFQMDTPQGLVCGSVDGTGTVRITDTGRVAA